MEVSNSLFSAIRVVAHLLAADGEVHAKEQEWFLWCIRSFELSREQRDLLRRDLKGEGELRQFLRGVTDARDQVRLGRWARTVVQLDGRVSEDEKEVLAEIQRLGKDEEIPLSDSIRETPELLMNLKRDEQLWADFAEAGGFYTQRVRERFFNFWEAWGWHPTWNRGPRKSVKLRNSFFLWGLALYALFALLVFWFVGR